MKIGTENSVGTKRETRKKTKAPKVFEDTPGKPEVWELRLYVAGSTPKSLAALANLKRICDEHLLGQYHIEIVDLLEKPQLAKGDQIVAIPTLVRRLPSPVRKIIGHLSDTEKVLVGLQLLPREPMAG